MGTKSRPPDQRKRSGFPAPMSARGSRDRGKPCLAGGRSLWATWAGAKSFSLCPRGFSFSLLLCPDIQPRTSLFGNLLFRQDTFWLDFHVQGCCRDLFSVSFDILVAFFIDTLGF